MARHGPELLEIPACAGLPSLFNHGGCRDLCGADPADRNRRRHIRRDLGLYGLYRFALLLSVQDRQHGLQSDDNGNIIQDQSVQVGDVLRFHHSTADGLNSTMDATVDLTVMAKVRINNSVDTHRQTGGTNFYMPTENFKPLCTDPHVVNFSFNVKPGQEMAMEDFLTSYTENIEPGMDYESKQTYVNSFHDLTSMIITIGGALSVIIGLIGITNFINSMLTSIITRKKEFAMLQSIGMTGKQLKSMLACEGLYYAIGTILASAFFGTLFSLIIVQGIANSIWFFTYRFVIWPMLVIYPFLLAVTIIIPSILYRKIAKTSIIERLRTYEESGI